MYMLQIGALVLVARLVEHIVQPKNCHQRAGEFVCKPVLFGGVGPPPPGVAVRIPLFMNCCNSLSLPHFSILQQSRGYRASC